MVNQTDLGSSKDCGVIVYTILNSRELYGIWTSPQEEYYGKIGTERAHKRTENLTPTDKLSGDYDLTIWTVHNQVITSGIMKIVKLELEQKNPVDPTYVFIWVRLDEKKEEEVINKITVDEKKEEEVINKINNAIEGKINEGTEAIKKAIKDAKIEGIDKLFVGVGIKMGDNVLAATFCGVPLTAK